MSLQTPTTADINELIISGLEQSLNQTIPLLPRSFLRVLAKVLAAVFILLYKYGGFMFLQIFVSTATNEETTVNGRTIRPLTEWGRLIGVGDPTSATNAELTIEVTVENQTGTLPSGTQLIGSLNGVIYVTKSSIFLDAATKQVDVLAVNDQNGGGGAGAIGNLEPGDTMNFANPLPNVVRETVVIAQVITGADAEDTEIYRRRVVERFQKRPQGGAYVDYRIWAEEVEGIVRAYPYTSVFPGQVDVYSEATPESSGNPDGIPTPAQLQQVLESIELDENGLASRRPANAWVNSFAIVRTGFDVRVTGLNVANPSEVQDQITAATTQYFLDAEPYIFGLDIPPRRDTITRSAIIGLVEDIVTAAAGTFSTAFLTINATGESVENYTLGEGEKAKTVDITFI